METQNKQPSFSGLPVFYILGLIACCLLPLLYIHLQYDRWNPFRLNGKKFLVFYIIALLLCHALRALDRTSVLAIGRKYSFGRIVPVLVLLTGLARLIQGIYHAKPVGYLILLLLLHLALLLFSHKQQMKTIS